MHRGLVLVLLLAAGLAGCLASQAPASGGAPAPGEAIQPGVEDPVRVVVDVTEETREGPPIAGATVVFFEDVPSPGGGPGDGRPYVTERELPPGETTDLSASEAFEVVAVGRTDADGRVVGHVSPDATPINVAVGGVDGWTTEARVASLVDTPRPGVRGYTPGPEDGASFAVPLYRRTRPIRVQGTMNTSASAATLGTDGSAPLGLDEPAWEPTTVRWTPDARRTDPYVTRLDHLDLTLRWNNTLAAHGDLYLRALAREPVHGPDKRQTPASGPTVETLDADVPGRHDRFRVGPATNTTVAAPDGLDYRITGEASFVGAGLVLPDEPG